jgi:hypothetical protein
LVIYFGSEEVPSIAFCPTVSSIVLQDSHFFVSAPIWRPVVF